MVKTAKTSVNLRQGMIADTGAITTPNGGYWLFSEHKIWSEAQLYFRRDFDNQVLHLSTLRNRYSDLEIDR